MSQKLQTALYLLKRTSTIFLHVDSRTPGLALPARLIGRPQVVLQVGRDLPVPIPDLQISSLGVSATLSFHGEPHLCVIPWDAVKAMCDETGQGRIFDQAWFDEVAPLLAVEGAAGERSAVPPPHPSERPYLRRVK